MARQSTFPKLKYESWSQAFELLSNVIDPNKKTIIFFDEISWMAQKDKDFAGQLKISWDTQLKKFPKLMVVLCGSVSSWIDKNILNNTGFMGRNSLDLKITELPLFDCNLFWGKKANRISSLEKLKILSVTGGVPRYLEEIDISQSAEYNIKQMCFSQEGILFSEFDKIFNDIFERRASSYKMIISSLANGSKTLSTICETLNIKRSGVIGEYIEDLIMSGFIAKDFTYKLGNNKKSRFFRYRLCDNYLRFYLRYINPISSSIEQGLYKDADLKDLINWEVIMGFQFENLVLNNLSSICKILSINPSTLRSTSPYFQKQTQTSKACQVDLLIQTKYTLYICEIKFQKKITKNVIHDMQDKISKLKIPKNFSVRPILIYAGQLENSIVNEDYFDQYIQFEQLLKTK